MSKSDSSNKSRSRIALVIGGLLFLGTLSLNWGSIQFRQQSIERIEAARLEAYQLSKEIDISQKIQNEIPQKKKLAANLGQELDSVFDMFGLDEFRDELPANFLPSDSGYLYVCNWPDYQTLDVHGRLYVPDTSKHRLVFYLQRIVDDQIPPTAPELKFDIQGPGWIRFGWQQVINGAALELHFHCDGSAKKVVPLPKIEKLYSGGSYGQHQKLIKQRHAWQNGWWQSQETQLPDCLNDNWLIMLPIKYEFEGERDGTRDVEREIFICLESDGPIYFSKTDFARLQRNGDQRTRLMKLDPETGYYKYDPGKIQARRASE